MDFSFDNMFGCGPTITRETIKKAILNAHEAAKQRFESSVCASPRERQIIDAFDGNSIFPPYLFDVMVRHGLLDGSPAWTDEEFTALQADLREAATKRI
jgi:hypothetical protein